MTFRIQRILFKLTSLFFISSLFSSCMTMADYDYTSIDNSISVCDYSTAAEILENQKYYYYSSHEKVLQYLDQGLLLHFAHEFDASTENLDLAEKEIDFNYTKSISQQVGKVLVNDNVADYEGEVYEDIYSNIFMCLNYIHLKKNDDAMVEIRRFDNKMKVAGSKFQAEINQAKLKMKSEYHSDEALLKDTDITFYNSAFARYLSMLLYRTQNDYYSAKIDYDKITEAFWAQKNIYNFSMPENLQDELELPEKFARVNLVSFTGLGPLKYEEVLRIPFSGAYYKLALPVMRRRGSFVYRAEIVLKNCESAQEYSTDAYTIESIQNIAADTYKQHYGAIYARTLMRSISKSVGSGVMEAVAKNAEDQNIRVAFGFLNFVSQISTEVTERADVRICRYFPATVKVAGINVPQGIYDVEVRYYNAKGNCIYTDIQKNVEAKIGELNLIESAYLR
ncbi:hypothetical protein [Treponema sp.]|uniref:hypothetical protein n=1 Tax=Treponema sp. TaxID=166 RepID=UPI00298DC1EB|nr:hypothetical protein [Treponema sp.]MCR5613907.1 hypothetical protein [Treponema sp.]